MKTLSKLFHPLSLVFILLPAFIYTSASLLEYAGTDRFTPKESILIAILALGVAAAWFLLFIFTVARTIKSNPRPAFLTPTVCPKCGRTKLFRLCPACDIPIEEPVKPKELKEKDLNIYDVWESPNGNLFLKVSEDYSLALGTKGDHAPSKTWGDLDHTQYVKSSDVFPVVMVGRLIFSDDD
jgi:hypothetical protein